MRRAGAGLALAGLAGLATGLVVGWAVWHQADQWSYRSAWRSGQPCRINLKSGALEYLTLDGQSKPAQ